MKIELCTLYSKSLHLTLNAILSSGRGAGHVIPSAAMSCFPGFLAAIEACSLNWKNVDLGLVPKEGNHQPQLSLTLNGTGMTQSCNHAENGLHENVLLPVERYV